jgi:hypothetical protein
MVIEELRRGFSVIINCTDNKETVAGCIEYLKKNSILTHEIILVGNAPNIAVRNLINSSGYSYILAKKPVVPIQAYNIALDLCSKDVLLLYDEHYIATPDWDKNIVETIETARIKTENIIGELSIIGPQIKNPAFSAPLDYGEEIQNIKYKDILFDTPYIIDKIEAYNKSILAKDQSQRNMGPLLLNKHTIKKIGGLPLSYEDLELEISKRMNQTENPDKIHKILFTNSFVYSLRRK